MAKLFIKTSLKSVVIVGEFCEWDLDKALRVDLKPKNKTIVVDNFPKGEYRVLSCKNYQNGEVYPTDRRQMQNRYFNGNENEQIHCYF
jgi:hypothetical protein